MLVKCQQRTPAQVPGFCKESVLELPTRETGRLQEVERATFRGHGEVAAALAELVEPSRCNPGLIEGYLKDTHFTFPILPAKDLAEKIFPVLMLPQTWFVDSDGRRSKDRWRAPVMSGSRESSLRWSESGGAHISASPATPAEHRQGMTVRCGEQCLEL